jgi:hypothetical protein
MDSKVTFANNRSHFSVDRDQVIAGQDTIPAGWAMGFANKRDAAPASGLSASASLIELIVKGPGSLTASASGSDSIAFVSDAGRPSVNDWYGVRLDLQGVEVMGYGYVGCLPNPCASTVIKGVTIADAQYWIAIDSLRAGTEDSVTFRTIKEDRHIYLNNTDVVISRQFSDRSGRWTTGACCRGRRWWPRTRARRT